MTSPAILWRSQPSSTSSAQILEPSPPPPPLDPAPSEPKPTPPAPKPNPKKNPKASSSSSLSSAKKNPQRGLGVAQLERIRLQNIAGDEIHQFPVTLPSIYEQQALVAAASCTIHGGGGSPLAYATGAASGKICYVPAQYRVGCGYGGGPASAIRSVMHEQYSMDRVRIGSGSVVVLPPPPPELPSNQRPAAVCIFDHCEFCLRKRIMSEFSCRSGVDNYIVMDEMERRSFVREREIMEYEFFPHSSSAESNGSEGLGLGGESAAAAASPSATSPYASNFVDLSLKLF